MMIGLTNAQPVRFYISAEIMSSGPRLGNGVFRLLEHPLPRSRS
jgi:hypothetical protein